MIKNIILMLLIVCTLAVSSALAQSDSLSTKTEDSTLNEKEKFHIVFGAGISASSNADWWDNKIPAMNLGTEISTSKNYTNAVQIYVHTWMFDITDPEFSLLPKEKYIKLSKDYYCHISLHGMFKYYIGDYISRFRMSLNIGYGIIGTRMSGFGIDYGAGFYYKILKDTNLELSIRRNTGTLSLNGSQAVPNILLINMYYKL